jgi:pSer/pThr/pTyr-binding forkhead associated (FHA) protein
MSLHRHLDSAVDFALKVGGTIQTQTSGGTTMAVLELTGPEGRDTIELVGERLTIGRSSDNDVVLKQDSSVSRQHARLELLGSTWYVKDLNSTNGVEVGGKPVLDERALHHGDEILLGNTRIVFLDRSQPPDSSTRKKAAAPKLTPKEKETLVELCRPLFSRSGSAFTAPATVRDMADRLFVGEAAVKAHLGRMYDKFGIYENEYPNRRNELANQAIQRGVVTHHDYKSDEPADA